MPALGPWRRFGVKNDTVVKRICCILQIAAEMRFHDVTWHFQGVLEFFVSLLRFTPNDVIFVPCCHMTILKFYRSGPLLPWRLLIFLCCEMSLGSPA